jgi:hypothetical protein
MRAINLPSSRPFPSGCKTSFAASESAFKIGEGWGKFSAMLTGGRSLRLVLDRNDPFLTRNAPFPLELREGITFDEYLSSINLGQNRLSA